MEANQKLPTFPLGPSKLIIDLLGFTAVEFLEICANHNNYETIKLKKRSGGTRTINEPCPCLKKFQTRLLKRWLYRMYLRGFLDERIYSFLPKLSAVQNVQAHADKINSNHVIRFDLKNAFPSISSDLVAKALEWAIKKELDFLKDWKKRREFNLRYGRSWREAYPRDPLFPYKKTRWFRKMIKNEKVQVRVEDIISQFIWRIIKLTTYNGCLPQGAPSSPFLLNLVVSYLNIPENISAWLKTQGYSNFVTAYCDDFVISTFREPDQKIIDGIISIIEKTGLKVNQEKTLIFNRRRIAPLIMGLRLTKKKLKGGEIKPLFISLPIVCGSKRRYTKNGTWQLNTISVTKKYLKQTRAMMHNLSLNPLDEKLCNAVKGRLSYIKTVYGYKGMPNQLKKPWEEIQESGIKLFKNQLFANT